LDNIAVYLLVTGIQVKVSLHPRLIWSCF